MRQGGFLINGFGTFATLNDWINRPPFPYLGKSSKIEDFSTNTLKPTKIIYPYDTPFPQKQSGVWVLSLESSCQTAFVSLYSHSDPHCLS